MVAVIIPDTLIFVALALPNTGVTNVGLVANTAEPLPVSSVNAADRLADVNEPNDVVVLLDVIAPVRFGILVVEVAVPLNDVAVMIPATNPPEPFRDTIALLVFALVALEVTVNVDAPELLNVVEPDNPVPDVLSVNVFCRLPLNVDAVIIPDEFIFLITAKSF